MALLRSSDSDSDSDVEEEVAETAENTPMSVGDPVAVLAAGSVLFSWYQFYVKGDREYGIFTGLWAPTLLTAADYLQQKDLIRKLRDGFSSL